MKMNQESEFSFLYRGKYYPKIYWQRRLSKYFDLVGAGCVNLGPYYNAQLYKARLRALERGLHSIKRSFRGSAVLEAGCGTGFYTEYCARQGVKAYIGIDIAQVSVYTLQRRYPYFKFIQADISTDMPSDIGDFDIILAADIMFHIIPDDAFNRAIQNLLSYLKPGGLFIISDLFLKIKLQPSPHVCFHSIDEYIHLFNQNHVYILHQEPIFLLLYPLPLILYCKQGRRNWFQQFAEKLSNGCTFNRIFPIIAYWLDEKIFLPLVKKIFSIKREFIIPNMKWLFATKGSAYGKT